MTSHDRRYKMNKAIKEEDITVEAEQPEAVNDMVEGFSLTGDILRTIEDKKVTIENWTKRDFPDFKNPNITKKKAVLDVRLSNQASMEWIPNKTSLKSLMKVTGSNMMTKWVGKEIELEVVKTKVSGEDREVIYVKDDN